MKKLNLSQWPRKAHFEFFKQYDEPFFGVCTELDFTPLYQKAKSAGESFYLHYLHNSLRVVNELESFRYRIASDGTVDIHERIDAAATVDRPNGTFGFSHICFHPDFNEFCAGAKAEIERVRTSTDLTAGPEVHSVVHYTTLPWMRFTSISHARRFHFGDSAPKVAFGKMVIENSRMMMPVSVHIHHALADGRDIGIYLARFEELIAG